MIFPKLLKSGNFYSKYTNSTRIRLFSNSVVFLMILPLSFSGSAFGFGINGAKKQVKRIVRTQTPSKVEIKGSETRKRLKPTAVVHKAFESRAENAMTGSEFFKSIKHYSKQNREKAIVREVLSGNIPSHLRILQPISVSTTVAGKETFGTYYVLADYLAVGADHDFVYTPLTPGAAQYLAERLGFVLPTKKMVDSIYKSARLKIAPSPLTPGPKMTSIEYYQKHSEKILKDSRKGILGTLWAGHKKDVVRTNKALSFSDDRVAIYGWHRPSNHRPIQGLSLVHSSNYADYSHGIRMVFAKMEIQGEVVPVETVLKDDRYSDLVSDEGPLLPGSNLVATLED